MDYIVWSRLLGTRRVVMVPWEPISNLVDTIMEHDTTTHVSWLTIESEFLGNRETRALFLDAEFRNFTQGALH